MQPWRRQRAAAKAWVLLLHLELPWRWESVWARRLAPPSDAAYGLAVACEWAQAYMWGKVLRWEEVCKLRLAYWLARVCKWAQARAWGRGVGVGSGV